MSTELKIRAIKLRKDGLFYSEIARELAITKSKAYHLARSAELNGKQLTVLKNRLSTYKQGQIRRLAKINKQLKIEREENLRRLAVGIVSKSNLSKNQKRILCAVMFWCEGGKNLSHGIHFMNSDPKMVRTFLTVLRQSFPIKEAKLRALIHLHEYHDENTQLQFWSGVTGIPKSQFYRSYLKANSAINIREGYPGCISIRYSDASLGKLLKMIYSEFGAKT